MSQSHSSFPIRTTKDLQALESGYFKRLSPRKYGEAHVGLQPILLTPQRTSLLVVRATQRQIIEARQRSYRGARSYISSCNYYRAASRCFLLVEISWATGAIEELGKFWTRKDANTALKAAHASR